MRWGLVPSWSKDIGIGAKLINARAETVAEKPTFRAAFRHRRCLVPADGFYEWQATGGRKQPWRVVRRDRAPFAFAGLWELWEGTGEGSALETFSIVTTEANATLRNIHSRMPVMLFEEAQFKTWLAGTPPEAAAMTATLRPGADRGLPGRSPGRQRAQRRRRAHRADGAAVAVAGPGQPAVRVLRFG